MIELQRIPAVLTAFSLRSRTTLNCWIKRGTLSAPVRIGRAAAWPEHEIAALVAARKAGASDADLRTLVRRLEAARANRVSQVTALTEDQLIAADGTLLSAADVAFNQRLAAVLDPLVSELQGLFRSALAAKLGIAAGSLADAAMMTVTAATTADSEGARRRG